MEGARVEVERQALQNKQEFSEAALRFEVQKLEIQAGADVQKAFAAAIGQMLSEAKMQIFGDPTTLSNMTTTTLTTMDRISRTSNSLPANVSASKMIS